MIREMSIANLLWGTPRIHGELLKIGIEIGQTSVAKYMAEEAPSLAGMEDVPSQPCGWHCRNGPLRRADDLGGDLTSEMLRLMSVATRKSG
jgi:hypothetical protein